MGAGSQLRECSMEIKSLGLRMNKLLYQDGDVRKGKSVPNVFNEEDLTSVVAEIEEIRKELWWIYNDNKSFGEDTGYIID